ncbi:A disintegrin and metalloproteinase with thrombospondin motifs 20 isoform X2 [Phlebotomus papatasi]|uniref:A disintegrin and metalloproteinase with thrombospondin motifs 20 isoform X2 n=1 Tax=Phlebotomus papatasi TaxID=29031 RepID=UPI0024837F5A|nr:A disintegrin and metalloproteinase with thrombospondin motifs 20 isoform X2 [Phlebotomus papatasi]
MTTRWRQKVTFAAAVVLLIVALGLGIFVWTAVSNGVFTPRTASIRHRINISDNQESSSVNRSSLNMIRDSSNHHHLPSSSSTTSPSSLDSTEESPPRHPPDIDLSHFDYENIPMSNVEYVKPSKIHTQPLHADDLLYESKNQETATSNLENHRITGHFRNKSSRIWDPHPQYEIDAFGLHMHLILYQAANFIHNDLKVTHIWPNETLRRKADHKDHETLQGCFYRGHIRGDEKSFVSVNLCDGMRGHIRTSSGSFFIQPVEKYTSENENILHIVYRLPINIRPHDELESMEENSSNSAFENAGDTYSPDIDGDLVTSREPEAHVRRKRSHHSMMSHNEYTMEILVAVDKKMQEYHGDAIQEYVLTLMSIVSSIFSDATIGNSLNVAVVHILLLKHDLVMNSNHIGVSASSMLAEFCKLKQRYHNFQHDTALLLTREQICRNANETKCDTLGLAELGTMCRATSCSLVQDNGLSAAFTIAHELGHVLSMPHDDDPKCGKFHNPKKHKDFIMSRMLDHNTHPWAWSDCSRHFITEYLEKKHGNCMLNKPERDMIEPSSGNAMLAGEKFTDNQQCELVFGPGTKICSYMPVCNSLWCTAGATDVEGCRTQAMPWADGTKCGENQWCQKAQCVHRNRSALKPVDGGWGPWSSYSECSRSCGGGVHAITRECNNPEPTNGGKYCVGERKHYESCNTHNCPVGTPDAREEQCRELDNDNFDIVGIPKNVKWIPKYGASPADECKLYCRVQNTNQYFVLKDKVKDGTPCSSQSFNKCVNGLCRPAGCDNVLDSSAVLDKCGVCNGKNDTCEDVFGSLSHQHFSEDISNRSTFYYRVTMIPKGSTNIEITQPGYGDDHNYIALMDDQGNYLLNGENLITQYPKVFAYADVTFDYNGAYSALERVNSTYARHLKRDLIVEVLSVRPMDRDISENLIQYSYSAPKAPYGVEKSIPQVTSTTSLYNHHHHRNIIPYQWKMSEWSRCSQLCIGKQSRSAVCIQMETNAKVPANYCQHQQKPQDEYEVCNIDCRLDLELTKSDCSKSCGDGIRTLKYICIQIYIQSGQKHIVEDSHCQHISKPSTVTYEKCQGACKDATWAYGGWEPCTETCGGGLQNRSATCLSHVGGFPIDDSYCSNLAKEDTVRICNVESCPEWAYGEETPVTDVSVVSYFDNYDPLIRSRPKELYEVHHTIPSSKPRGLATILTSTTTLAPIIKLYQWRASLWGQCSVSCGEGGIRIRSVRCSLKSESGYEYVADSFCDPARKPVNKLKCSDIRCPEWIFLNWSECGDDCTRRRHVICQGHRGQVDDKLCPADLRPPHRETCCHYRWRSVWSPCSATCGHGIRKRERVCMRLMPRSKTNPHPVKTGKRVDSQYCPTSGAVVTFKRPTRPCKKLCQFRWETSPWTKCNAGCGTGFALRNVTCTNGRVISQTECSGIPKPSNAKPCEGKSHCTWKILKPKNCSCGGYMKRRAICMDTLRNVRSSSCPHGNRPPPIKQRCQAPPNCSCRTIQYHMNTRRDGEYVLNVRGRQVSIYCHRMNTNTPKEYLTLKAGSTENYSMYYDKRSKDRSQCPDSPHHMFHDETIPSGTTWYSKVRLNLHTLQVINDDFAFAHTQGHTQPFASAGDCFSITRRCPKGVFSVNLEGTGFRIRPTMQWETKGQSSAIIFHQNLEPPYFKVIARCGGYCGNCFSSRNHTLTLDVL